MNIDDLSYKRLEELIKAGLVSDISTLYDLSEERLMTLDKVKEKLASKIINNIQKSKEVELPVFLSALGVSGAAINKCEKIVDNGFNTIEKILNINSQQLSEIEGFAEKSANDFVESLETKKELIKTLLAKGITIKKASQESTLLMNKKFCFTGTLSRKRGDLQRLVKENGGINVSSVSKNTDYLVTNDTQSTSSKFKKASELNIPIISEGEFLNMLGD
jgi:DNA ligase (NAD+)